MSIYTALENKYMANLIKESAKKQSEMIKQLRLKEKQKYYGETNETNSIPISSVQKSVPNYFDELMNEQIYPTITKSTITEPTIYKISFDKDKLIKTQEFKINELQQKIYNMRTEILQLQKKKKKLKIKQIINKKQKKIKKKLKNKK